MMNENILELIPQRPPFVMVEKLVSCNYEQTITEMTIRPNNLFVENNIFTEMGILENIAQTCAARLGFLNKNQPVKIGMIGSVNNFELSSLPSCGKTIQTTIDLNNEVFNVIVITANVTCEEKTLASCKMKVILTEIISE
ncbi:hypothetical protein LJC11_02165 [Bacteroidales bacterium OttesenSCG-928-I21]|nr:hypothetical protein [Bacteroidales bacterium OttesenSCG-928-I21]